MRNLRQLGIGAAVYTGDTGRLPSFLEWLYPKSAPAPANTDLTKGQLYPYVKSKAVYLCPSEKGTIPGTGIPVIHSYQMPCMICHAHDPSACMAPSRTVHFLEATSLSSIFPEGIALPPAPSRLTFWHNSHEYFLMVDTHIERLNRSQYGAAIQDPRFWYPTKATGTSGNL